MIRGMNSGDISSVIKIERDIFSDPWSEYSFLDDIYGDIAYNIVYVENNEIIGYACSWMMLDEMHITNIAVREDYRGRGIGKEMISSLIEKAKTNKLNTSLLEVRVSNISAIRLYKKMGYEIIHQIKRFYTDNDEDAYLMKLDFK